MKCYCAHLFPFYPFIQNYSTLVCVQKPKHYLDFRTLQKSILYFCNLVLDQSKEKYNMKAQHSVQREGFKKNVNVLQIGLELPPPSPIEM